MAVYKDEKRKTWYFVTRVEMPDGTKKQVKRRGFKTKKEAILAEARMESEQPATKKLSFDEVAVEYMDWYSPRRKVSSAYKILSVIDNHLTPTYGKRVIDSIQASDVMDHQTDLIKQGYAAATIKKIHSIASAIFKFAIKRGYRQDNPATLAGMPEMQTTKHMAIWTLAEFQEFIAVVDDPMHKALFMTLYYSGARKGELLALTWADIDFDNSTIHINKTVYKRHIQTPKTPASIRMITMPEHTMRLLRALHKLRKPKPIHDVFSTDGVVSMCETYLTKIYDKYVKQTGVKRIRIHDFRHSHASYLINKGIGISVVAARLGHGDVSMTLNVYSHLYPSTEKEAALSMEDDFKTAEIVQFRAQ